jgi:CheY-like chemotaxis protein
VIVDMTHQPFILIAEDDVDDRMLIKTAFEESNINIQIEFVGNGSELFDFLDMNYNNTPLHPQVILLDLNMPKKDGRETLKEIKQHPVFKKIPVVIFTTTKNENEITRCYELGANTYVVKPDSFEMLRKIAVSLSTYWFETASVAKIA